MDTAPPAPYLARMQETFVFRHRAHEVTRLEAFSDIVFGFALTLLVVSLEVPKTFEQLMHEMRGFPGFAICFAMLMWLWHAHHTFFRRYGLTDGYTITLNTILLFLILFYVYPLKFLFAGVTGALEGKAMASSDDVVKLFTIYGLGFAGIFLLYVFLYLHALRMKEQLRLTPPEIVTTKLLLYMYAAYVGIGALSTIIALTASERFLGWAGWVYFLIGPASGTIGTVMGKKRDRIFAESLEAPSRSADDATIQKPA